MDRERKPVSEHEAFVICHYCKAPTSTLQIRHATVEGDLDAPGARGLFTATLCRGCYLDATVERIMPAPDDPDTE